VSTGTLGELAVQVIAALAVGWVTGDWVLHRFLIGASSQTAAEFGLPERALFALIGFFGFSIVAMVVNLVTGGAVFGLPAVLTVAGIAVVALGARRFRVAGVPWAPLILFLLVLLALYMRPVVAGGSGARLGDPQWHLGWTEQLLHGQAIPTGPAPELARNAYPWGFHAVLATLVRLVPGSSALPALDAVHVLILLGLPLTAASLARRLRPDAGWFAAIAVSLVGGFGWLSAHRAVFAASPSQAHHGADLVVASPNAVYELFPPALPRELALVTLGAAALFMVLAVVWAGPRSRDGSGPSSSEGPRWKGNLAFRYSLVAGVAGGITGLISVPLFVTVLVWSVACAIVIAPGFRLRFVATFLAGGVPVFALWAAPVVADYLRFGGFVNVTPHVGTEWGLAVGLASWGLLLPGAAAGVVLQVARRHPAGRPLLAFAAASALLMAVAIARPALDWHLAGNRTLLYQGRVWPPAHLLGAAFAGVAAAAGFDWLRRRGRLLAWATALAVLSIGAVSPALASIRLERLLPTYDKGFIFGSMDFAPQGFVRRAASHLGPSDVVLVHGSEILAFSIFSFSGARLARFDDPTIPNNDLRIRFPDLAAKWDRRMADGGFRWDFTVAPASEAGGGPVEARGLYQGEEYVLIRNG
jgi:hypothetical protein